MKKATRRKAQVKRRRPKRTAPLPVVPKGLERTLRKEAIAEIFDVHPKTVIRWAKDGCPHARPTRRGAYLFNEVEVMGWVKRTDRQTTPGRPTKNDNPAMGACKLRKEAALADTYELRLARERGQLIPIEEVEAGRVERILAVKHGLMDLQRRFAAELESLGLITAAKRAAVENLHNEHVQTLLKEFAK